MPAFSCSWPCTTSSSAGFPSSPPPTPTSSTYYFRCITNFEAKYTYGNRNKGIKIAHWNKGGAFLINKMPDVQNVIQQHHPHILGLSEANLLDTHDQNIVAIPDYTLHVCPTIDNPALRTSRVVVYTHKDVIVKIRPEFMSTNYSSIWLEVGLPNHRKFLVCQTYREWQYSNQRGDKSSNSVPEQLVRWLEFLDQWERALATDMEVHCLGDLNLNHCNWTDLNLSRSNQSYKLRGLISALFTRILPHGVTQLVNGPTRHFPGQVSTGLDHYFSNRPDKISSVQSHHCGGSDHMLIMGVRHSKSFQSRPKYIRKRSYKDFDPQAFLKEVQQVNWLDLYLSTDVDEAVKIFSQRLTDILDVMAPVKTFQVRTKFVPWLSKDTVELMKERDRLHKIAAETNDKDDWKEFKMARNKINNKLKYEESKWQKFRLEQCGLHSAKVWKNVKGILNWQSSGSPSKLFYKGKLRTKAQDVADSQNEFFIEKVNSIRSNLSDPTGDPLSKLKALMTGRQCSFQLDPVHPDQVDKIISSLSNSKATGLDNIDTSTLKLVRSEIIPAVTHIINLSITNKKFPTSWKSSKVIPLHKSDDPLNPKNYRPVTIVPILSKILERAIFNQIIAYLDHNRLVHPNHHAYRAQHNTNTALVQMYDGWLQAAEAGQMAGVCLLDMSAAFDVVDHGLLTDKLALYGFDQNALDWLTSYLGDRSQCVLIEGCLSKLQPVHAGVPQGSILGPLLYTLFTNELPEVVHDHDQGHVREEGQGEEGVSWPAYNMGSLENGSICCYADDTTFTITGDRPADLSFKLTERYKVLAEFMLNNRLKLNDEKTHLLVMSTSQANYKYQVTINTPLSEVKPSKSEKLLGCRVQDDLKWTEYLRDNKENLIRSLNTRLGALKRIRKLASFRNRKMIAEGIVVSKLSYLISLWGGCGIGLRRSLQVILNKAARVVTRLDWSTSTKDLLSQCGWFSVNQLIFYHSVLQLHKVRLSSAPKYLHSMHMPSGSNYQYRTRQAESGSLQPIGVPKLEISKNRFKWRSANLYNQLPADIRKTTSIKSFKFQVKAWIKKNISFE